jgi:hypothetical protein
MIDYTTDHTFLFAINKPESGLCDKINSMIVERWSLSNQRVMKPSDELGIVSFNQEGTHEKREQPHLMTDQEFTYARQVVPIEVALQKSGADYAILYGEQPGNGTVYDTLLINTGRLALDLIHYHEQRAEEGELPKKHWDYSIWLSVADHYHRPLGVYEIDDYNLRSKPESSCVEYIMPLSRILVAKVLSRAIKESGMWTNLPLAGPATNPKFYEHDCRIMLEDIAKLKEQGLS